MGPYEPLADPGSEIRIATIQPGGVDEPIVCSLDNHKLGSSEYEALSYCWGNEEDLEDITLQSVEWQVTGNLHAALKALRSESTPRKMWIDALCINQRDNHEKNQQVPIMAEIYASATQVIAWIGPAFRTTDFTFRFFEFVSSLSDQEDFTGDFPNPFKRLWEYTELWEAILEILRRPYWSRLWVVQEYSLSPRVLVQCGSSIVESRDMAKFSIALRKMENFLMESGKWDTILPSVVQVFEHFLDSRGGLLMMALVISSFRGGISNQNDVVRPNG